MLNLIFNNHYLLLINYKAVILNVFLMMVSVDVFVINLQEIFYECEIFYVLFLLPQKFYSILI